MVDAEKQCAVPQDSGFLVANCFLALEDIKDWVGKTTNNYI